MPFPSATLPYRSLYIFKEINGRCNEKSLYRIEIVHFLEIASLCIVVLCNSFLLLSIISVIKKDLIDAVDKFFLNLSEKTYKLALHLLVALLICLRRYVMIYIRKKWFLRIESDFGTLVTTSRTFTQLKSFLRAYHRECVARRN